MYKVNFGKRQCYKKHTQEFNMIMREVNGNQCWWSLSRRQSSERKRKDVKILRREGLLYAIRNLKVCFLRRKEKKIYLSQYLEILATFWSNKGSNLQSFLCYLKVAFIFLCIKLSSLIITSSLTVYLGSYLAWVENFKNVSKNVCKRLFLQRKCKQISEIFRQ